MPNIQLREFLRDRYAAALKQSSTFNDPGGKLFSGYTWYELENTQYIHARLQQQCDSDATAGRRFLWRG